ncbi:hypothetical protein M5D96_000419 [Drosophila gunungcola]|uniref:Uncharacterized protein n=1 Tax=Drosophila gunungcola TaxID=103775 RepID=A0A9P9YW94_9MUSC|nr:hypothetical protein M5D96_000419 [Drosophila gunungcola]
MKIADNILQILVRVLQGGGYVGDLLQLIAVIGQSLDFANNTLDVLVFGYGSENKNQFQRDLGEELVLVGVQSGGHSARTDAAVGLADGAASFLDARKDEQIVEQEEATILARPLARWHGDQVEEQELPFGGYKIGDSLDDALQFAERGFPLYRSP